MREKKQMSQWMVFAVLILGFTLFPRHKALGFTRVVEVTAGALNVRSGPSTKYRILGAVRRGQRYVAFSASGIWHTIWFRGRQAWVSGKYLRSLPGANMVTIQIPILNVRIGPGTRYYRAGTVLKGQKYIVLAKSRGWRKIWFDGFSRWLYGGRGYASDSFPAPAPAPAPTPAPAPNPAPVSTHPAYRSTLSVGKARLYLPKRYIPKNGKVDLVVHFHGAPSVVEREFDFARIQSALVNVTYPGLSSAYKIPFSNKKLFGQIVNAAIQKVGRLLNMANPTRGNLRITSFSAGFGAVNQILKVDKYWDWISGICMLDSLHSGYIYGKPNSAQLANYRKFALLAAQGKKTLILTHSSIVPYTYASTTETAEYLRTQLGYPPKIPSTRVIRSNMKEKYTTHKRNFYIYGFYGNRAVNHTHHLRYMGEFLRNF